MGYRILGFLVGLVVAIAVFSLLTRNFVVKNLRALSDCTGALKVVEIQYSQDSAKDTWPCLSGFFNQIDPSVRVVAACSSSADAEALRKAWHWKNPLDITVVGLPITGWSKDRFLVLNDQPITLKCPRPEESAFGLRNNDSKVAEAIAKQWPDQYQFDQSPMVFEAGDILCDDHNALYSDVLQGKNPDMKDLEAQVQRLTHLRPLRLAGAPGHHIGMFAAPLDHQTVVVGDVDMGKTAWTSDRLGKPDFSAATTAPFRKAVEDLKKAGYRVIPAPLIVLAPKVYVTYTNGVFETVGKRRVAYIPSYGDAKLDELGANAYRQAGWEVHPVPVQTVFKFRGTIGCLINVLQRS